MRARVRKSVQDEARVPGQGDTDHRMGPSGLRSPQALNAETLLSLQRVAGNRAVRSLLAAPLTLQRTHHDRAAAVSQLGTFKQGTWGYSLWGVYRNFNRFPTTVVGDGSGLGELVQKESGFSTSPSRQIQSSGVLIRGCGGRRKPTRSTRAADPQTKKVGAMLAPETRATMLYSWSTGGQWVPDFLKSAPKDSSEPK